MADNTQEIKVKISGDDSGAKDAVADTSAKLKGLSALAGTVNGAFRAIGEATKFLGRINWAIQAVITLWQGLQKVQEWMHRAETAAKALREELAKASYENAVAHAAESYRKLNKNLEETVRLEKERSAIIAERKTAARDIEDADAERRKQLEISRLDPNAANYDEQKKAIERRYEIAASDTKAARAREDNNAAAKDLYDQAKDKDSEADKLENVLKRYDRIASIAVERSWKAAMDARGGDEDAKKKAEEAAKEERKAVEDAKKIREQMEAARKEAESLRRLAGEKAGGNLSANIRNDAEKLAIENNAKADVAEKKKQAEQKAKEKKTAQQNLEDKKLARQKEEDLAALDPTDKDYEKRKREIEYTYAVKAAENKVRRADNETDLQAAEEEKKTLSIKYNAESRNADLTGMVEREEAWREKLAAQQTGVSQNRLTAMGLGSGGIDRTAQDQAKDVKTLVSLAREQIAVIRENKPISRATYAP